MAVCVFAKGLFRKKRMLKEVEVIGVSPGTFERVRHTMATQLKVNPTQTKIPRVVRDKRIVELLEASVATPCPPASSVATAAAGSSAGSVSRWLWDSLGYD